MVDSTLPPSFASIQQPSKISHGLLYLLTLALLACILGGGALYLYSAYTNVVSDYRRSMNAATYEAQIYFNQRETMLHWLVASAYRHDTGDAPLPGPESPTIEGWQQIPLTAVEHDPAWRLALSSRVKQSMQRLQLRPLHTSLESGVTRYLDNSGDALPAPVQAWIANFLAKQATVFPITDPPPAFWLHPPGDTQPRLFLYTLLDSNQPSSDWIGLESYNGKLLPNLPEQSIPPPNYLLVNPNEHAIVKNGIYLDPPVDLTTRLQEIPANSFRITWAGYHPNYLVLSKQISEGGWRLIYYVRFSDMLSHGDIPIYPVATVMLLLCALVLITLRQARTRILVPAKHQYDALQESERLTRTIIAAAPIGLCLLDRQRDTPLFSNAMAEYWLREEDPRWRRQALQNGTTTTERRLNDGRSVHLSLQALTYHGQDAVLCAFSDITALKEVEESLRAEKHKADAASQAKSEFLAIMSHEIRTPLFGIMGTLELLGHTALAPNQQQYLRTACYSSTALLQTIDQTLSISSAETCHEQVQIAELSPTRLVYNVIRSYADKALSKGLLLYSIIDPDTPACILGDELRLRRLLNNLVNNAIKFTRYGQVVIRLRARAQSVGHTMLNFQVADTGMGIAPEAQQNLFSPYYQVKSGSTDPSDCETIGTGLGLFICKRLATAMQGELSLTSAQGLGTSITFSVSLPTAFAARKPLLQPDRVYVSGSTQEVVMSLCAWLQKWGLIATPYQAADIAQASHALLLQAWPHADKGIDWPGRKLILLPADAPMNSVDTPDCWYGNAHSLEDLYHSLQHRQNTGSSHTAPPMPVEPSAPQSGLKALIVDDNAINRQVLEKQLQHLNCQVLVTRNGQEALHCLTQHDVDLILTDLHMPIMDGYALARQLRQQHYIKPIYGVTASLLNNEHQAALAAGMNEVMVRPVLMAALKRLLQTAST